MSTNARKLHIVRPHPDAVEALARRHRAGEKIAEGFKPRRTLNLKKGKGRTLNFLQYRNYYLGSWSAADMANIDAALGGAMTDPALNRVMQQYFSEAVVTQFCGSTQRGDSSLAPGTKFDRNSVQHALASLDLSGVDLSNTVVCLYLPPGVLLQTRGSGRVVRSKDDADSSLQGLGGYHGSADIGSREVLYAVAVYSQSIDHRINGIPFWPDNWKNVVATMYHELNEARTDPDVEKSDRTGDQNLLGWYSQKGGEIGDIPMTEAGDRLGLIMMEVPLVAGGSAPIQLMWSNRVGGPCGPF